MAQETPNFFQSLIAQERVFRRVIIPEELIEFDPSLCPT
jgi:hypothetical protein